MPPAVPAAPQPRRGGLSLGARISLLVALLLVAAVGSALLVTTWNARQVARETVLRDLATSAEMQSNFQVRRLEKLELISLLVVEDPNLTAYVAEAAASGDLASILDLIGERQESLRSDFAIVLDPYGRVLAHTGRPEAAGEDLSRQPLVEGVLGRLRATSGSWREGNQLFDAVAVPFTQGVQAVGFLVTGFAIDDTLAREAMKSSGTEVAVLVGEPRGAQRVIASTVGPAETAALPEALAASPGVLDRLSAGSPVEAVELDLAGEPVIASISPLLGVNEVAEHEVAPVVGLMVNFASLDSAMAPFRTITNSLLLAGAVSILAAFALAFPLAASVLRPIRRLAAVAAAARAGDYDQRVQVERDDEVGELARAFDALLSELREKRDMEAYVGDLSRNLPGEAGAGSAVEAVAEAVEGTILTVDLRPAGAPKSGAQESLEGFSRALRRLHHLARGRRGRVVAVAGHRAWLRFVGESAAVRALATAAEALAAYDREPGAAPAAALASGWVAIGPVDWGEERGPGLVGRPIALLDGLLREAAAGEIVFAADLRDELAGPLARAGYDLAARRGVLSPRPLFLLDATAARKVAEAAGVQPATASASAITAVGSASDRPTLSALGPGSLVAGRYEILAELGAGGMGVVYKARDRELDEIVALKMLHPDRWGDAGQIARLKDELKLARKITHPNVLRTFDLDEADGIPFLTMEYVRGVTLRYMLDQSGRLPYSAGLRLARQLCRGLAAAHAVGVIHRDIKPENLILEANGNAKLMDFGIARPAVRITPGLTQAGWLVGTPHYLAPEQLQGKDIDHRADLYAAGVVLYEVFTGKLPYGGGTVMEVVGRTLHAEPEPPRTHWPEMPPELEAILMSCLKKDPAARYRDAAGLVADLDRLKA